MAQCFLNQNTTNNNIDNNSPDPELFIKGGKVEVVNYFMCLGTITNSKFLKTKYTCE